MANIHLTPDKPYYPGGSWHIEGMLNERIIATGIYYYDSDNISESQLDFRTSIADPPAHVQDDSICMQVLYGQDRGMDLLQERGSISTSPGLALAFPNIYQHHVSPFHLVDLTKPGRRKILAFFLVDPNHVVPSTSNVAPQQKDWMLDFMHDLGPNGIGGTRLAMLPTELRDTVVDFTEGLMDWKQADAMRAELMKERSHFVNVYNEKVMQVPFNLFSDSKPKLPKDWPSPLHHKCSVKKCTFPNVPQPVEGRYTCLAETAVPCKGTYEVTSRDARAALAFFDGLVQKEQARIKAMAQLRVLRRRKDDEHFIRYQRQLDIYRALLKAVDDGDEATIHKYILSVDQPALGQSMHLWQEHIAEVRGQVPKLEQWIEELFVSKARGNN
ncbi:hypothetical protein EUX98_g2679 [Antrodiella citrinella]|uniref:DUF4246 domain-containing protein n=1 Tax=Antrodiella citrinella TaxID=2447956 RepID=A0A4S4N0J7_9APHY|nr:hypothetical protein EUX98_g2679 [Antrodiella citrinella]